MEHKTLYAWPLAPHSSRPHTLPNVMHWIWNWKVSPVTTSRACYTNKNHSSSSLYSMYCLLSNRRGKSPVEGIEFRFAEAVLLFPIQHTLLACTLVHPSPTTPAYAVHVLVVSIAFRRSCGGRGCLVRPQRNNRSPQWTSVQRDIITCPEERINQKQTGSGLELTENHNRNWSHYLLIMRCPAALATSSSSCAVSVGIGKYKAATVDSLPIALVDKFESMECIHWPNGSPFGRDQFCFRHYHEEMRRFNVSIASEGFSAATQHKGAGG